MVKTYLLNKKKVVLLYLLIILILGSITVLYILLKKPNNSEKFLAFIYFLTAIASITIIYLNPKSSFSLGACLHLKIRIDNSSIYYFKQKKQKTCKWADIDQIEFNNFIFFPESRLTIWFEGREDEPIAIPVFMKNSKQLYKEIYENVKEKSPNAKIDRRFIKYVEEKC